MNLFRRAVVMLEDFVFLCSNFSRWLFPIITVIIITIGCVIAFHIGASK